MTDFYQLDASEQAERLTRLAESALQQWGVQNCKPRLIKYRENAVFEVVDKTNAQAAMRVHRQGYHSNDSLNSELQWIAMLRKAGMQVPSPIPIEVKADTNSRYLAQVTGDETPGEWQVDMLSWMDGRELGEVGVPLSLSEYDTATLFTNIGECMANLHNLTSQWPGTPRMQRHSWDHDGLVGDEPLWGQFWQLEALDNEQRIQIEKIKQAVSEDLTKYGVTPKNYGLIHADLVPENVMIKDDQVQLIDFDDAGFGWYIFEIATALHWLTEEPQFDLIQTSILEGYQKLRPLSKADIDSLPLFHVARSLTYLGWVHTRSHTDTAVEMTPTMIDIATSLGEKYLQGRS